MVFTLALRSVDSKWFEEEKGKRKSRAAKFFLPALLFFLFFFFFFCQLFRPCMYGVFGDQLCRIFSSFEKTYTYCIWGYDSTDWLDTVRGTYRRRNLSWSIAIPETSFFTNDSSSNASMLEIPSILCFYGQYSLRYVDQVNLFQFVFTANFHQCVSVHNGNSSI